MNGRLALPRDESTPLGPLLRARRTTKAYSPQSLSLGEVATALWCAVGSLASGRLTTPSARSSHLVTATLVAGAVRDLPPGAYAYDRAEHALALIRSGDLRQTVADATLDAAWLGGCSAQVLLSADLAAAAELFDDQRVEDAHRLVWLEAGHASQNVYLWAAQHDRAAALVAGLRRGGVPGVEATMLPRGHQLLGVVGIGHVATSSTQ